MRSTGAAFTLYVLSLAERCKSWFLPWPLSPTLVWLTLIAAVNRIQAACVSVVIKIIRRFVRWIAKFERMKKERSEERSELCIRNTFDTNFPERLFLIDWYIKIHIKMSLRTILVENGMRQRKKLENLAFSGGREIL